MNWPELLQTVVSGVVTGGATSATAILSIFRDIKHKVTTVEDRIGQPSAGLTKATGFYLKIEEIGDKYKELENKYKDVQEILEKQLDIIRNWEDNPPEWLARFVARNRTSVNMEMQQEFEARIENRLRSLQERISREIDSLEMHKRRMDERYVSEEAYLKDIKVRAEEIAVIRESLAGANGLLKGLLVANGIIDADQKKPRY